MVYLDRGDDRSHLLDIAPRRDADAPIRRLLALPSVWRHGINRDVLNCSGVWATSSQFVDPFHMIRLGE